jgi:hypothetical protein
MRSIALSMISCMFFLDKDLDIRIRLIALITYNVCYWIAIHNYDKLHNRVKKLEEKEKQNGSQTIS